MIMEKRTILNIIGSFFIFFLIILGVWTIFKTFIINKPKAKPGEVAVAFLKASQGLTSEDIDNFLSENKKEIKIFEEKYQGDMNLPLKGGEKIEEPAFTVEKEEIGKTEATVEIAEVIDGKQELTFYGLSLPQKVVFKIILSKEGNWKKGFSWRIREIDSSDIVKKVNFGDEIEIEEEIFLKVSKLEEYNPKYPGKGLGKDEKLMTILVEFENKSTKKYEYTSKYGPNFLWILKDNKGKTFPAIITSNGIAIREPALEKWRYSPVTQQILEGGQKTVAPGGRKEGYITFKVPKDFFLVELIIQTKKQIIIYQR